MQSARYIIAGVRSLQMRSAGTCDGAWEKAAAACGHAWLPEGRKKPCRSAGWEKTAYISVRERVNFRLRAVGKSLSVHRRFPLTQCRRKSDSIKWKAWRKKAGMLYPRGGNPAAGGDGYGVGELQNEYNALSSQGIWQERNTNTISPLMMRRSMRSTRRCRHG